MRDISHRCFLCDIIYFAAGEKNYTICVTIEKKYYQ